MSKHLAHEQFCSACNQFLTKRYWSRYLKSKGHTRRENNIKKAFNLKEKVGENNIKTPDKSGHEEYQITGDTLKSVHRDIILYYLASVLVLMKMM